MQVKEDLQPIVTVYHKEITKVEGGYQRGVSKIIENIQQLERNLKRKLNSLYSKEKQTHIESPLHPPEPKRLNSMSIF